MHAHTHKCTHITHTHKHTHTLTHSHTHTLTRTHRHTHTQTHTHTHHQVTFFLGCIFACILCADEAANPRPPPILPPPPTPPLPCALPDLENSLLKLSSINPSPSSLNHIWQTSRQGYVSSLNQGQILQSSEILKSNKLTGPSQLLWL